MGERTIPLPRAERLQEQLDYNPATGVFKWKVNRVGVRAGSIAGSVTGGYRTITLDGVMYKAHRLAWKMQTGSDPLNTIDHINNDRSDNRFSNLREATRSEQGRNKTAHGSSAFLGVSWIASRRKFQARITVNGRQPHLGYFNSEVDAAHAYNAAASKAYGAFANLNNFQQTGSGAPAPVEAPFPGEAS